MSLYYQDDRVTLYHGDCLEIDAWLNADVLVTDPPYGLGEIMQGGQRQWPLWVAANGSRKPLEWDSAAPDCIPALAVQFKDAIIWGGNYFALPPSRGWLVWDKVARAFASGHCELAWTSLDQPVKAFNMSRTSMLNEDQRFKGGPRKWHPTEKPVSLMSWCIQFTSGGVVADPFAGSGSTLIAARNLGRKAVGVEMEERYCELIARRLDQQCFDFEEPA